MTGPEPASTTPETGGLSRRSVLKGLAVGAAGVSTAGFLSSCTGGSSGGGGGGGGGSKSTTLGSSASDPVPKSGIAAMVSRVQEEVRRHGHHQHQVAQRLPERDQLLPAGQPGRRVHLVRRLPDAVLRGQGPGRAARRRVGQARREQLRHGHRQAASTGDDGKKYFVPNYNYPWAVFYRKSLFAAKGYQVPTTFDEFKTLCAQMKKDGLIPIAFGDKDGWPAMGTFDYLNMRLNGYQFHVDLMAHKESWDQQKVERRLRQLEVGPALPGPAARSA